MLGQISTVIGNTEEAQPKLQYDLWRKQWQREEGAEAPEEGAEAPEKESSTAGPKMGDELHQILTAMQRSLTKTHQDFWKE
ncbi:hypothetical protein NDU88_004007 [Pleurodeles waltl]|uniref:Uncharacterized protein n=1 Tax=Pleurodeles waltl TaxID=8319 RepID=A0AAV7NI99_PLEWA|nr:hypothetical protein NDU88_004007 [Pleurodeles waltl]